MRGSDKEKNIFESSHDKQIGESLHDQILFWLYERAKDEKFAAMLTGQKKPVVGIKREIERPLRMSNYGGTHIKGFIDLQISTAQEEKDEWEDNEGKSKTSVFKEWRSCGVEIKTSVNVGETIRQINYYHQCQDRPNRWAVCAPDFPRTEVLEEQGIIFIPYEPEESFL